MKYLGVMISSDGNIKKEIESQIGSTVRMIGWVQVKQGCEGGNEIQPKNPLNAMRSLTYNFAVLIECRGTWMTSSIRDSHIFSLSD